MCNYRKDNTSVFEEDECVPANVDWHVTLSLSLSLTLTLTLTITPKDGMT
jgi:hypothetical protein